MIWIVVVCMYYVAIFFGVLWRKMGVPIQTFDLLGLIVYYLLIIFFPAGVLFSLFVIGDIVYNKLQVGYPTEQKLKEE